MREFTESQNWETLLCRKAVFIFIVLTFLLVFELINKRQPEPHNFFRQNCEF